MSPPPIALRTIAFGDVERTVWGAAWIPDPDGPAFIALGGNGDHSLVSSLRVSGGGGGEWRLDGDRAELLVSGLGEAVAATAPDDHLEGFDQLCRVTGRFELDGAERGVDCLGLRMSLSWPFDLAKLESVRAVSTWFEPDEGLALVAFRTRKAKAHDADVIAAAVLGPDRAPAVQDPRLSTTYEAEGWPVRAGLELWFGSEGEEEQFPRRASGEATGVRAQGTADGLEIRAEPFRWHSRGREGAGLYMLARRA